MNSTTRSPLSGRFTAVNPTASQSVPVVGHRCWRWRCWGCCRLRADADTAYMEDFEDGVSGNWFGENLPVSQATGANTSWYLGQLGNDTVALMLDGLDLDGGSATPNIQGQHTFLTVSYDLFVIGGWTGNNDNNAATAHTFAFDPPLRQRSPPPSATSPDSSRPFPTTPAAVPISPNPAARVPISSTRWASAARPPATTMRFTAWRAAATNRSPSTTPRMT